MNKVFDKKLTDKNLVQTLSVKPSLALDDTISLIVQQPPAVLKAESEIHSIVDQPHATKLVRSGTSRKLLI